MKGTQSDSILAYDILKLAYHSANPLLMTVQSDPGVMFSVPEWCNSKPDTFYVLASDYVLHKVALASQRQERINILSYLPNCFAKQLLELPPPKNLFMSSQATCLSNASQCLVVGCFSGGSPFCFIWDDTSHRLLWYKQFKEENLIYGCDWVNMPKVGWQVMTLMTKGHGLAIDFWDPKRDHLHESVYVPSFDHRFPLQYQLVDYNQKGYVDTIYLIDGIKHLVKLTLPTFSVQCQQILDYYEKTISQLIISRMANCSGPAVWIGLRDLHAQTQQWMWQPEPWISQKVGVQDQFSEQMTRWIAQATFRQGKIIGNTEKEIVIWDPIKNVQDYFPIQHRISCLHPIDLSRARPIILGGKPCESLRTVIVPLNGGIGVSLVPIDNFALGKRTYTEASSSSFSRKSSFLVGSGD